MLNIFKKKKEVKKVYVPNTLSKILNVLPFIPLTLLLLTFLFADKKDNSVEQLQDTINEVTAVDGDNIVDEDQYTGFRMVDANTYVSYSGKTTVKLTSTAPSTYGWSYLTTERQPIMGIVLLGKMYHKNSYSSVKAVFTISGRSGLYVTVTTSSIDEFIPACEKAGELLATKLF